jgi:hypothetical protein
MSFLDTIRERVETLEERLADEERQKKEAQERLDREDREAGMRQATGNLSVIQQKILAAVDERQSFYMAPVGRGRTEPMTPFEEGYANEVIRHFFNEGLSAELKKTQLKTAKGDAFDYEVKISWN